MLIDFEQLFQRYSIKADFCLHVGANEGEERFAYQKAGIEKVIWVEAEPIIFQKLCRNTKDFDQHICLRACVSDKDNQSVKFNVTNNHSQSSSILPLGTHKKKHPEVHVTKTVTMLTQRLDTLLKEHGIQLEGDGFLNIDLQGAELKALRGMGRLIEHFKWIYLEVNWEELYVGCPLIGDLDAYLAEFDFERVETVRTGAGWGDGFYVKKA